MPLQRITHAGAAPPTGLAAPINATATSFTINSATGYPTGASGPFVLVLDPGTASEEKVLCASLTSTTVTVATSGRGWDGTVAVAHGLGTANVAHVFTAAEADDANSHIYVTSRDDHPQYALANGARATYMFAYIGSGTYNVTGGTSFTVPYGTVISDTAGHYNATTFTYTCPVAGCYRVRAQVGAQGVVGTMTAAIVRNGSVEDFGPPAGPVLDPPSANSLVIAVVERARAYSAGDTLSILGETQSSGGLLIDGSRTSFEIDLLN